MSSGLDADTDNSDSPGHAVHWVAENNWVEHALNLPMAFNSGEKWVYNDICAMLTGAIIQEVSGKNLAEFAEEHLFTPLGIKEYYWYTGPNNRTGAMGNLYITVLDFAKIGWLVSNKGKWNGQQIISEKWISEISKKHLDLSAIGSFARLLWIYVVWEGKRNKRVKNMRIYMPLEMEGINYLLFQKKI